MALVKKNPGTEFIAHDSLLVPSANGHVVSSVQTIRGEFTTLPVKIEATGVVTYDPRALFTLSARTSGRLEKVYVHYLYQRVRKGDKIAEIYSPELAEAQRELLYLLQSDPQNSAVIASVKQRMLNLGMNERQVARVADQKEELYRVPILSTVSGVVIQRGSQAPSPSPAPMSQAATRMADAVGTATGTTPAIAADLPREGTYVTAGQPLFDVVSLSNLVVEINLPAATAETVTKGAALSINREGKNLHATVDLVQPYIEAGTEFVKLRSYIRDNPPLTVGQLVTVSIHANPSEGLWVPASATVDMGNRHVVFVKQREHFVPVEVVTGISNGDKIRISRGLTTRDEIARNAKFMVDNEGFIKLH